MEIDPQVVAIPLYMGLMALEMIELKRERSNAQRGSRPNMPRGYEPRDTAASLSMGVGSVLIGLALAGGVLIVDLIVYNHRIFDLGDIASGSAGVGAAIAAWALLVLLDDFCYYWFHRAHHRVRFFWACHVSHHSSQRYNLSTALRQPWQEALTQMPFYLPLFLLGFTPAQWAVVHGINLIYQFWIHTETIGTMWRPVEAVMNTPSHHRVHHGSNKQYLDKNYGGILIVFDRWFGTFEPEDERVTYGLVHNIHTYNPFRIAFHEYAAWWRDLRTVRGIRAWSVVTLGPPGWREHSSGYAGR